MSDSTSSLSKKVESADQDKFEDGALALQTTHVWSALVSLTNVITGVASGISFEVRATRYLGANDP